MLIRVQHTRRAGIVRYERELRWSFHIRIIVLSVLKDQNGAYIAMPSEARWERRLFDGEKLRSFLGN